MRISRTEGRWCLVAEGTTTEAQSWCVTINEQTLEVGFVEMVEALTDMLDKAYIEIETMRGRL